MLTQKQINDLFARKVPMKACEELIDELLLIAYNKPQKTMIRDKAGKPVVDDNDSVVFEDLRPYPATSQIAAIKMIQEYAIGKPGNQPEEEGTDNKGSVVVILPSNNR